MDRTRLESLEMHETDTDTMPCSCKHFPNIENNGMKARQQNKYAAVQNIIHSSDDCDSELNQNFKQLHELKRQNSPNDSVISNQNERLNWNIFHCWKLIGCNLPKMTNSSSSKALSHIFVWCFLALLLVQPQPTW